MGGEDECLHDDRDHRDAAADTEQAAHRTRRKANDTKHDCALAGERDTGLLRFFKGARRAAASYGSDKQIGHEDEGGDAKDHLERAAFELLNDVGANRHTEQAGDGHDGGPTVLDALLSDVGDGGGEGCHQHHGL